MTMICPPAQLQRPRGRRFRRGARPRAVDGRRGFPARHGRDLDLRHRHAGHGAPGRERRQMLAARQRDEGPHRPPARRNDGPRRQRADQALRRQAHDQPGDRGRHRRPCRLDRGRQDGRSRALAARLVRHQALDGDQERLHRLGRHGRRQRQPRPLPSRWCRSTMWGALGTAPQQLGVDLRLEARDRGRRRAPASGSAKPMVPIKNVRTLRKTHMVRNTAMPHIEVDPQTFEVRADGKLLMCDPAIAGSALAEVHAAMNRRSRTRVAHRAHRRRARRHRRPRRLGQDRAGRAADPRAAWPAASTSRSSPTTSSPPRTPSASAAPASSIRRGSRRSKPAPARTPSSARTRPSTSRPPTSSSAAFPASSSSCSKAAATTSPRPSRATSRISGCSSSTSPAATTSRASAGPGVIRCDLLVINKTDLAPHVGVDLDLMVAQALAVRDNRPVLLTNCRKGEGIEAVVADHRARRAVPRVTT